MQALVLEDFGRMAVQERPEPTLLPGWAAVEVHFSGICGTDVHGYTGANGRRTPGQIMGHEASGVVRAAGAGVDLPTGASVTFNPMITCSRCGACGRGERQLCETRRVIGVDALLPGAFAQTVAVPAGLLTPLPDGLAMDVAALVEPLAVSLHATRISGLRSGDGLLVIGGGPIGQCAAVVARSLSVDRIVVSELNPARQALCRDLGAEVVDPGTGSLREQIETLGTGTFDVVIDTVGLTTTVRDGIDLMRRGGRLTLVGLSGRSVELDAQAIIGSELALLGSYCYSDDDFADAVRTAAAMQEELRTLISRTIDPGSAPEVFADLASGGDVGGKVLIRYA